jgi:hypothetical protein
VSHNRKDDKRLEHVFCACARVKISIVYILFQHLLCVDGDNIFF